MRPYDLDWSDPARWQILNLDDFPDIAADISTVNSTGTSRAFALSMADIVRLSGPGRAFTSNGNRAGIGPSWWFLRTRSSTGTALWIVGSGGGLGAWSSQHPDLNDGGVRPALIINPSI